MAEPVTSTVSVTRQATAAEVDEYRMRRSWFGEQLELPLGDGTCQVETD